MLSAEERQNENQYSFKACCYIVIVAGQIGDLEKMMAYFRQFLEMMDTLKPKNLTDTFPKIVEMIQKYLLDAQPLIADEMW